MTLQGHVTTASLKQANKEYTEGHCLPVCISKKLGASILETSHSKLKDPKQYDVKV